MYIPIIPIMVKIIPEVNNMAIIMLAHPVTWYPLESALSKISEVVKSAMRDMKIPRIIEIVSGRCEKDKIISTANLILFFIV
jgi:hypothetical protein